MGSLTPLFWTSASGDVCPGFQSQGGFPRLRASSSACNRFFRFTSGATPADLLAPSMAAGLILYMHVREVGYRTLIRRNTAHKADVLSSFEIFNQYIA